MKKTNFLVSIIVIFSFISCSNNNDASCGSVLEPINNEFTYNCNSYHTENGRLNISPTVMAEGTTPCMIEFINDPYSDFVLQVGDKNINLVRLWLTVPVEAYYNNEIPEGQYKLKTLNSEVNEQYEAMDIANTGQIVINGKMITGYTGTPIFHSAGLVTSDFDDVIVDVDKTDDVYTVQYYVKKGSKEFKGRFVGVLPVVHNWN